MCLQNPALINFGGSERGLVYCKEIENREGSKHSITEVFLQEAFYCRQHHSRGVMRQNFSPTPTHPLLTSRRVIGLRLGIIWAMRVNTNTS